MAGLRCASCGAEVNPFAGRCDRCGADPDVTVVELGGDGTRAGSTPNRGGRRPWVPILVAVVAAWVIFAFVGALDDDDETASDAPGASSTTGVSIRLPRATTTTVVPVVPGAPVLGEPTGLHLLADTPGALLDVDLDTGVVEEHTLGGRLVAGDERGVLVDPGSVLYWHPVPFESAAATVVASGTSDAWLLQGAAAAWVRLRGGDYQLVALDGSGPLATVSLPPEAEPVGTTGDLLVVAGLDRVFTIDPTGAVSDRGSGIPIAAGHGYVVVERCDPDLDCGPVRVELATGDTRPILLLPEEAVVTGWSLGPGGQLLYWGFGEGGAGLFLGLGDSVAGLIEPGGSNVEVFSNAGFSPDGRWIVAAGNGSVWLGASDGTREVSFALGDGFADGLTLLIPTG